MERENNVVSLEEKRMDAKIDDYMKMMEDDPESFASAINFYVTNHEILWKRLEGIKEQHPNIYNQFIGE